MTHDLMTASPSVAAWRCDPMTVSEIDAHPDAGRVWATIVAMREEIEIAREETEADIDRVNAADDKASNDAVHLAGIEGAVREITRLLEMLK